MPHCGLEERVLLSGSDTGLLSLPLMFEENRGQLDQSVQFVARGTDYQLSIAGRDTILSLRDATDGAYDRISMALVGGLSPSSTQGLDQLPTKVNYFIGPDPSLWRSDVPTYAKVKLADVYPGIDLLYYGNQGQLEYDFSVAPGIDPRQIAMRYNGASASRIDDGGNLMLATPGGTVVMHSPILYQTINGARRDVAGAFELRDDGSVGFVVGSYDGTKPLVIDPILQYATYFGGSGNDQALAVAVDDQGAAYFTGSTLSVDLATTASALAPTSFISEIFKSTNSAASWNGAGAGLPDASFSTLVVDPTNPNIIYGGTDNNNSFAPQGLFKSIDGGASWAAINNGLPTGNSVTSLVIDPQHPSTLYVTLSGGFLFKTTDSGTTWTNSGTGLLPSETSAGLGALAISASSPQTLYVMGSRNYLYKTTNGGANWTRIHNFNPGTPSEIDQLPFTQKLIVDPTDPNIIYAGVTKGVFFSTPGNVYKSTNGGATFVQTTVPNGAQFSVVDLEMDPADHQSLYLAVVQFSQVALYRTQNGGASWTQLSSSTNANDLAIAATPGGSTLYMSATNQGILKSTDKGATFTDAHLGVSFLTKIGVSASSPGTLYAASPGRPKDSLGHIATDAFVAKLNPSGSAFDYITYLGGPGVDVGYGVAVDSAHNAYVTGKTIAGTFPTTPGAFQAQSPSTTQRLNAFVTKLSPTGSSLVYSTYLAGTAGGYSDVEDHARAIAVDNQGRAAVTGVASSGNFPSTPNAFDPSGPPFATAKAFVTLIKADGTGLDYSTFLGGSGDFDIGSGIAFDGQGNIHVVGETGNTNPFGNGPTSFPTTAGAYQSAAGIPREPAAFYSKINPSLSGAASLVYSTVFYGSHPSGSTTADTTSAKGVAVDPQGRAYVVGNTLAPTLPMRNGFDTTYGGDDTDSFNNPLGDGFLAVFDPSKSGDASLLYSTFIGGTKADAAYAVAVEGNGKAVVTGVSNSPDFDTSGNFLNLGSNSSAFITRVDIGVPGSASRVEGFRYAGRDPSAGEGHGVAVDSQGNIYLVGFSNAPDLQVNKPAQGALRGGTDAFIAKLSPSASTTDLGVSISTNPDPVDQNANLTLTITVTNNGPAAVTGAFLTDLIDVNDVFVSASPAATSVSGRVVNFAVGALGAGQSKQFQVVVKVGAPLDPNVNINNNIAIIRADRPDSVSSNDSFTAGTLIRVKTSDIEMQPSVVGGAILQGVNFTYELKVVNHGPDTATGVMVQATLPSNATFVSSNPVASSVNGSVRTFNLPDIPSGSSASVFITMTPLGSSGAFVNLTATAVAQQFETNANNNNATLTKVVSTPDQADLAITLTGPANGITGVGDISYTATVTNNGPHEANNVVVTADATALFPITSITPSQGTASQSNNVITALLGRLAVGASATVTFVIHVDTDAQLTVNASVKADESDPDHNNDSTKGRVKVRNGSLIFVVTNTNDSGPGSLRQALLDSEDAQATIQFPNQIVFNIPESDAGKNPATGAFVIRPRSQLPAIFNPAIIDGYTQPGSSPNTNPIDQADNAHIRIEIDGSQEGLPNNAFDIYASHTVIRGLAINSFLTKLQRGTTVNLLLNGFGLSINSNFVTVEGCFIGTDASGTVAKGNETAGIAVFGNSNTIGGTTAAARNVISGNGALGIAVATGVGGNLIAGNFIGTDPSGARALPTNLLTVAGLHLASTGVTPQGVNNTVGGVTPEARNIISGNNGAGVYFAIPQGSSAGSASTRNVVVGNYIGTDLTGTKAVPNIGDGIFDNAGSNNTIGGITSAERNIISGNAFYGVELDDASNVVRGNYIGTDVTGTRAIGNRLAGVYANGASGTVGGSVAGAGNIISGNSGPGVLVGYDNYTVQGNSIGVDANGNPLGNSGDGIQISQLTTNVNGAATGQGNTVSNNKIAYNLGNGVAVTALDSSLGGGTGNAIVRNSIFANKGLAIDLARDGVTPNHAALTTAVGPNHLQNYPLLASAAFDGTSTTIQGTLDGLANRDYLVQFFTSTFVDPSNFGEGENFLGESTVHTDANGRASFSLPFASVDTRGLWLSATASTANPVFNAFGTDTSEFSQAVLVTGSPPASPPSPSANIQVTAQVLTANPKVGSNLVYRFTVKNLGPDAAHTVVFSHLLPFTLQDIVVEASQGAPNLSGISLAVNLGTLASGASATITVTATPSTEGSLGGAGSADVFEPDPDTTNNTATFQTIIGPGAIDTDVAVSQSLLAPGSYRLGDLLIHKIDVTNNGPRVATGINLTDTLPAGAAFDSLNSSDGWSGTGARTLFIGALAPGDSISVYLAFRSTVAGDITNKVTASLTQAESNPSNNTSNLVTHVLPAASVTLLSGTPIPADPNQLITFHANVMSPAGGQPGGTITLHEGNNSFGSKLLDASGNASFDVSSLPSGVHTLSADYGGDPNFAPSSTRLNVLVNGAGQNTADLSLDVQAPSAVLVGQNLVYTYTVSNNGSADASNVKIMHTLPANVTLASLNASAGGQTSQNGNVLSATFSSLTVNATATLTVVVTPTAAGTLQLSGSTSAAETDPNTNNNSISKSVVVSQPQVPTANIGVAISPTPSTVLVGDQVTYQVDVSNTGPDTAHGVMVTVTLPSTMSFVSTSEGTQTGGVVTVDLGDLASGSHHFVNVVAQAAALGQLSVVAHVSDTGPDDPTPGNNSSTANITANPPNADLGVSISADHTSVAQGEHITYTVKVHNSGPLAADFDVHVALPVGATFVSSTQGSLDASRNVVNAHITNLALGADATFHILVTATDAGGLTAIAMVDLAVPNDLNPNNNTASTQVQSNAPITLNKTVTITFGTVSTPTASGYPNRDLVVSAFPLSTEVYNAILGSAGLDARVVAALTRLRDAAPANPSNLGYFATTVVLQPRASVFDTAVQKPLPGESGDFNSLVNDYKNLVTANAGSVTSQPGSAIAPLVFDFPNLTTADSGQVRNGQVTVNLINIEDQINGPIGTSTHLAASPNPVKPDGVATLVATVSGNGVVHPNPPNGSAKASSTEVPYEVTFFEGTQQLGATQIDANGRATIDVSGLAPGRHSIRAHYNGDLDFGASDSNTVVLVVGNLSGPRIVHVDRFGIHMQATSLLVVFDEALERATAADVANYRLVARGHDGKFGTRDDFVIKLKSATYDAATHAVTLRPARRLPLSRQFRLTVRGGVTDEFGTPLDGRGDGTNGSDYVTSISRGNLVLSASAHKHAAASRVAPSDSSRVPGETSDNLLTTRKKPKRGH